MKRFFSILLAAMIVVTSLATVALAAGSATVGINDKTAKAGEEVTLTVTVKGEFANYELYVKAGSPLTITNISGVVANVGTGKVAFADAENVGQHSFTVTVKVAEDAKPGTYPVSAEVLFVADRNLEELSVSVDNGSVTVVCDHAWGSGEVTKEATCTENGTKVYTCSKCGETKTETLYALGHNLETVWSWDKTTHWHECSRCGHKADHEDHLLSWHVIKKPTVSETGIKQEICEVCGYVAAEEILPKAPLDDVPHTGDITGQVAFAGFSAMMVLSAGLWLVLKRKAAK